MPPQRALESLETRRLLSASPAVVSFAPLQAGYFTVPSHSNLTATPSASTHFTVDGYSAGPLRDSFGFGKGRFGAFAGEADWDGSGDGQETGTVESAPAWPTSDDTTAASFATGHGIHSFGRWRGDHVGLPDDAGGFGPSDGAQGYDAPQGFHYGFGGMHLAPAFFAAVAAAAPGRGGPDITDDYADAQGGSAVFIVPGRGLPFGASPAIVIVTATAPPVAGPAFFFVPQPSGGSSGSSGTVSEGGGYASSSSAPAPPRVPGRRAHPAAAQGPSDAGDPAPIPMSAAAAAAGTLRPAVDGNAAPRGAAADAVALVQTAVASAADSNGAPGGTAGASGASMVHAIAHTAVTPGTFVVGEMVPGASPTAADAEAQASARLAEGAATLAQGLARQATVFIHSIESALQTPAEETAPFSDFVHLPLGAVRLLGLGAIGPESLSDVSDRLWRTTAVVSLAVTLVGYGYCKATSDRRRARLQQTLIFGTAPIVEVERPEEEG
jgi:hypothetical protein